MDREVINEIEKLRIQEKTVELDEKVSNERGDMKDGDKKIIKEDKLKDENVENEKDKN